MADLIGMTLGQYEIIAKLGAGGLATVYHGRRTEDSAGVAIKIIPTDFADSPEFLAHFTQEAETLAALDHPNIAKLLDFGAAEGLLYLVMELIEDSTLDVVLRKGSIPPVAIVWMLEQIASALDYAHAQGVVHRDLKPQNILLDETENAHLTDFGIAKLVGMAVANKIIAGTPAYMAPEQWRGLGTDSRSDIYALGVMLYEMLVGELPFQSDSTMRLRHLHLNTQPDSICAKNPDLTCEMDAVVRTAMAKNPDDRFQKATFLLDAFQSAMVE
jgi:serine/threonine-protein kinase